MTNLEITFEALAAQTMPTSEFEVVIGALDLSDEYLALCRAYADRLDIVSVVSSRPFAIPRARNLAMRQASGEVIVQIDADTLLPPDALRNLYDRHFAFGQDVCVVGQVLGYDNNERDVRAVASRPYRDHRDHLAALAEVATAPRDPRFQVEHIIPWAFAWTGLIALPAATVRRADLFFDESFRGWGVDDLEWGYRISAHGTPIVLCADVYGLHLPHTRDVASNERSERANYRRFLRKWPTPDVELCHALGDVAANGSYLEFRREIDRIRAESGRSNGVARGVSAGVDVLVVGVGLDAAGRLDDAEVRGLFDLAEPVEIWPLTGVALPFEDDSVEECRVLPRALGLSPKYREVVRSEADRVARKVTLPEGGHR